MIQTETIVNVTDNTGAKKALVIRILGQNKKIATIGDIVIVTIKDTIINSNVKKSSIEKGLVVRTKYPVRRLDGSYIKFDNNAIVIIDDNNQPKGSRIFGSVAKEIKTKKFSKIVSLAPEIL